MTAYLRVSPSCLVELLVITNATITHHCWDNFDLCEETPSGSGTTHSLNGLFIQELPDGVGALTHVQNVVAKTKRRSSVYTPLVVSPYFYNNFVVPALDVQLLSLDETSNETNVAKSDFLWVFSRLKVNKTESLVPSWKGWVSITCPDNSETKESIISYMPPIQASKMNYQKYKR